MKKLCCLMLCLLALGSAFFSVTPAYAANDIDIDRYIDSYIEYHDYASEEEFLSGARPNAGVDAVYCIRKIRAGRDFSAIADLIDIEEPIAATTHEKRILYKNAFGVETPGSKEDVYGLGIMSRIFGLHLLNNNIPIEGVSKEELVEEILSLRTPGAGWALMQGASDVDVTGMCLQALASACDKDDLSEAIEWLSNQQQQDGGYLSAMKEKGERKNNCESAAQVVIALSTLGIDCAADPRFVKNRSLYDKLLSFQTPEGVFAHEEGGQPAESASIQALQALCSYALFKEGKEPFYILGEYSFGTGSNTEKKIDNQSSSASPKITSDKKTMPINAWVAVGLSAAIVIICGILLLIKKITWKEVVVILLIGCGLSLFVGLSKFQSVQEYYADTGMEEGATQQVHVIIRKDVIDDVAPIIFDEDIMVKENATVLEAMIVATKKEKIQMSYSSTYISSIDNVAEFSYGGQSGWMFAVNGEFSDRSVAEKRVKEGDVITFLYTKNMGKDISDFFEGTA